MSLRTLVHVSLFVFWRQRCCFLSSSCACDVLFHRVCVCEFLTQLASSLLKPSKQFHIQRCWPVRSDRQPGSSDARQRASERVSQSVCRPTSEPRSKASEPFSHQSSSGARMEEGECIYHLLIRSYHTSSGETPRGAGKH